MIGVSSSMSIISETVVYDDINFSMQNARVEKQKGSWPCRHAVAMKKGKGNSITLHARIMALVMAFQSVTLDAVKCNESGTDYRKLIENHYHSM
jgi:hypothetical protein